MPISISINPNTGSTNRSANPVLYQYSSSATWTKPSDSSFYGIFVLCASGGGGGGSGTRNTGNTSGGGGGGGGSLVYKFIGKTELSQTHSITIGGGGIGGTAITTDLTTGIKGSDGGITMFGNLVVGYGGGGGDGGLSGAGSNGGNGGTITSSANYIPGPFFVPGALGAGGSYLTTTPNSGAPGYDGTYGGAGGAAGGNMRTTGATGSVPGDGGEIYSTTLNQSAPASVLGGAGATTLSGPGGDGNEIIDNFIMFGLFSGSISIPIGSAGGGGRPGNALGTIPAGRGGNGKKTSGGGGGGTSRTGSNSGAGGNGGDGFCILVELYGA